MGFTLDLAGIAALIGSFFFLVRRIFPPERLKAIKERKEFLLVEVVLVFVLSTGFLLEGLRISLHGFDAGSFIGNWIGTLIPNTDKAVFAYKCLWWIHGIIALGLVAYIPYSPLVHLVLAPLNTGLSVPMSGLKMGVMNFEQLEDEEEVSLGVGKLKDFSWKRFLDFSTCLWCGRCHEVCPAVVTGKSLSPKGVIVTLHDLLKEEKWEEDLSQHIKHSVIYSCTTCAACLEVCPVLINQPKAIMRMRQFLLMELSQIPETMGRAYRSLENRGHPFFGTGFGPKDWCRDMQVPIFEKGKTEYLLWIGCSTVYEERAQSIARATVRLLQKAGVSFGILPEVRCTGDPAKQMGSEFMFVEIAQQNIEYLDSLGVKKIITMCPHCYDSFVHYYPELGGEYEVIPHVLMIKNLIDSGRLHLKTKSLSITFHDSCYLGRHNRIFDEPRELLSRIGNLIEMKRNRENSFCCGGGGGNYWGEEEGTRINRERAKEAFETGADIVVTVCPFCLLMLTDGIKAFTQEKKVFDVAELVENSIE
jgi:Fe-S oxidoreductase